MNNLSLSLINGEKSGYPTFHHVNFSIFVVMISQPKEANKHCSGPLPTKSREIHVVSYMQGSREPERKMWNQPWNEGK